MVNLERTCVLLFCYFLCFKVNLDLENTNQVGESSPNFISEVVNLDPIILEKWWIDGESWPNDFVEKVNRGEDLRWVGSRCPLTRALGLLKFWVYWQLGILLTLKWPRGVPRDPRFVFRALLLSLALFSPLFFSNCLTIGYASFDAKKI